MHNYRRNSVKDSSKEKTQLKPCAEYSGCLLIINNYLERRLGDRSSGDVHQSSCLRVHCSCFAGRPHHSPPRSLPLPQARAEQQGGGSRSVGKLKWKKRVMRYWNAHKKVKGWWLQAGMEGEKSEAPLRLCAKQTSTRQRVFDALLRNNDNVATSEMLKHITFA
jgi:hypothetical protein